MGESTPLSVELIRDLYGDATAFHKAWDDSVDGLVEFGLVLPEAIEPLKLRGRAMHEAAICWVDESERDVLRWNRSL